MSILASLSDNIYLTSTAFETEVSFKTSEGIKTGYLVRAHDTEGNIIRSIDSLTALANCYNSYPIKMLSIYTETDGVQWNDEEGRETGDTWSVYPDALI